MEISKSRQQQKKWIYWTAAILTLGGLASTAFGEEGKDKADPKGSAKPLTLEKSAPPEIPPGAENPKEAEPATTPEPSKPFNLAVTYWLFSDYISRGVNCSEYAGEGREKLNHQLGTSLNVPLGKEAKFGTFGFDTWFEWYGGQGQYPTTEGGTNLQEVDYTLRWSYELKPIKTTATVAWTDYTYPHVRNVGSRDWTDEVSLRLNHNDAWLWRWTGYKGEDGILNPSLFIAKDFRMAKGWWIEAGINHPFPIVKNVTWTPSMTFAFDGKYIQPFLGTGPGTWQYAYTQWGSELKYDLTELLHLPPQAGTVYVSGVLYYNLASANYLHDELWGGVSLGWNW
jgi:hypothetical protein